MTPPPRERRLRTASSAGLIACGDCGTVWRGAVDGDRCERCRAPLFRRRPRSIEHTWALLIAAAILYLPANLLPVMSTRTLTGTQEDTILSGVLFFWVSGDWAIATVIFVASFLVPLFKLGALLLLAVTVQSGTDWARVERTRLYRVVETIGRWSMLDVFVVAVLAGLVRVQGFAEIEPGWGIAAFGAVVVLTMLASLSYDPRLAWDDPARDTALSARRHPPRVESGLRGGQRGESGPRTGQRAAP